MYALPLAPQSRDTRRVDRLPLGDYQGVRWWSAYPRDWGPNGEGRVWFGGHVLDGLADVIDEHIARVEKERTHGRAAALGCVPWLTSSAIVSRLLRLGGCCIVIDKGCFRGDALRRLAKDGTGFPNVLWNLRDMAPAQDGESRTLGPFDGLPEYDLGPVRFAGWLDGGTGKPLLHAKMLVLGELVWGEDEFGRENLSFSPRSLWCGSANWTEPSRKHLEVGFWSDDQGLVHSATDFLGSVIASFSEPWDSECAGPEPDLVDVKFDPGEHETWS
jgi:hypothetical protein